MSVRPDRPRYQRRFTASLQLGLVLGCVLALAAAGVGVLRLDVRPQPPTGADADPAIRVGDAYVADKPVAPKVRQVAVTEAPAEAQSPAQSPAQSQPAEQVMREVSVTPAEPVSGLATVGMTWAEGDHLGEDQVRVEVRSEKAGRWSGWERLEYHDDHGPDASEEAHQQSAEGRPVRAGTEPTVVGHVDRVQLRTSTTIGRAPREMKAVLIDPGADPVRKAKPASGSLRLSAAGAVAQPQIYSRAQWGADERIRDQSAPSYGTVQTGFVHHTVNANDYAAEDVPALLRGIYAYHVRARGWRDVGYNYLVDRFGRIWEGRYGGITQAVVGAHTLGYNEVSFAMSAIGNYDIAEPPQAVLDAYARLFAWKLSLYGIAADATGIRVKGRVLDAINGHRDVGQTACPGRYLYAKLPQIRAAAAAIQRGAAPTTPAPTPTPTPTPTTPSAPSVPVTPLPEGSLPARSSVLGDAWPDLVVRVRGTNELRVVPTGGQFGFGAAARTAGRWSAYDTLLAPGDLTGDGHGDLLVRSRRSGVVTVRAGDGAGHVGASRARTRALARYTWLASAGDVTKDGRPDLVAGTGTRLYLLAGKAHGRFAKARLISSSWRGGAGVGVGDADGDGRPEIAGVQRHRVVVADLKPKRLGKLTRSRIAVADGGRVVGAGDLTGDGRPDLVVRSKQGVARVYAGSGRRWAATPLGPFTALAGLVRPSVGTLDGRAVVVGYDPAGRLVVLGGNGRSNVGTALSRGTTLPDAGQLLSVGDWNRDGHGDIAWRPAGSRYLYFRAGDGAGGFGADVRMRAGLGRVGQLAAVGDVTGDGNPDLLGRAASGGLVVYPGDGGTGFKAATTAPSGLRSYNLLGGGLWNGGGSLVSADNTFVPISGTTPDLAGYDWVIGTGDVDGDGVADLLVREKVSGSLFLLPGTGSGFGARRFVAAGFGGYDLAG